MINWKLEKKKYCDDGNHFQNKEENIIQNTKSDSSINQRNHDSYHIHTKHDHNQVDDVFFVQKNNNTDRVIKTCSIRDIFYTKKDNHIDGNQPQKDRKYNQSLFDINQSLAENNKKHSHIDPDHNVNILGDYL